MRIAIEKAIQGASEFLSNEFATTQPSVFSAGLAMFAQYMLQTKGRQYIKYLDDGTGYINIDLLGDLVNKYMNGLPNQSISTPFGAITITADTPAKLIEHLKFYGEN